jgi:hypothetical protein
MNVRILFVIGHNRPQRGRSLAGGAPLGAADGASATFIKIDSPLATCVSIMKHEKW